jgi:hypothetical protein
MRKIKPQIVASLDRTGKPASNHVVSFNGIGMYLGMPHRHMSHIIMGERWQYAVKVTAHLMQLGYLCYSPIAYTHTIHASLVSQGIAVANEFGFYAEIDYRILAAMGKLTVLTIPGWEASFGVAREIEYCNENGLEVEYLDPVKELGLPLLPHITKKYITSGYRKELKV